MIDTNKASAELAKIDPKEFGLQDKQAETIEQAFMPKIVERDGLKKVYENLITGEISPALCGEAKAVRLKLVKVRTGIAEIHKTQKAFFLAAGRYVDAWKNKETLPVIQMEGKLAEIEEYYERIEAEKVIKLQQNRSAEIAKFQEPESFIPGNLGELTDEVYENYLLGVKTAFKQKQAAEKAAKEAEEKRIAEEKAEQERIRKENEQLKKEAEAREKKAEADRKKAEAERKAAEEKERKEREAHEAAMKAEREAREKAELELKAMAEAERKEAEAREATIQTELNKGDADKVADLISDLSALKTKYSFKSAKNRKKYSDVGLLIDKVINHINA